MILIWTMFCKGSIWSLHLHAVRQARGVRSLRLLRPVPLRGQVPQARLLVDRSQTAAVSSCLKTDSRVDLAASSQCYDRVDMERSTVQSPLRRALASDATRIGGLLLVIVALSLLHSTTNESEVIWHGLLLRLYYIPILIGAYWYGAFGGLLIAVASSMAYVPHLREQGPAFEAGRYAEIVVFHVIALTVGLLATAQRRVTERYQHAAESLERTNIELRESAEQLQRADRLKTLGEIAAGLAHEIRHPLASIRGALEIIDERSRPDSPEAEFSRLGMVEVQRLDNLVWEVFGASVLDAGARCLTAAMRAHTSSWASGGHGGDDVLGAEARRVGAGGCGRERFTALCFRAFAWTK